MAEPTSTGETPPPKLAQPATDETVKETFESIVIAFILAFVFRAYVVEAFVIPTGSMAPTLLGVHLDVQCEQCGYRFATDMPPNGVTRSATGEDVPTRLRHSNNPPHAICPMCLFPNRLETGTYPRAGDRILVQKYIYAVSEPQRWDVVVFKAPHRPAENFIKRLVGLPGEAMWLFEGNVYVAPLDAQGEPIEDAWRIARKTDPAANRQWEDVQRAVWQPLYHSQYVPLDGGTSRARGEALRWSVPWVPDDAGQWQLANRRSYRYTGTGRGRIRFDFELAGDASVQWRYGYNQFKRPLSWDEPIEDVRVAALFAPDAPGLEVALSTTARLADADAGPQRLTAVLDATGLLRLTATDEAGHVTELQRRQLAPLPAGTTTPIELWYVDQEASVWVDGERVLVERFDLPLEALVRRPPPALLPQITIEVAGSPVTLHQVEVDRDLYYAHRNIESELARGALYRLGRRVHASEPVVLGPDEFFCMGDNSPYSHDSRYWDEVEAWVEARIFEGAYRPGVIPRRLMMGQAFFVYFPAMFPSSSQAPGVFPNFGDMRFID